MPRIFFEAVLLFRSLQSANISIIFSQDLYFNIKNHSREIKNLSFDLQRSEYFCIDHRG